MGALSWNRAKWGRDGGLDSRLRGNDGRMGTDELASTGYFSHTLLATLYVADAPRIGQFVGQAGGAHR